MNFAEKLRQARLDAGLSQQQLADKSGVAMRTIQNWESAERNPSNFAKVEQLAKVLGVTTTELFLMTAIPSSLRREKHSVREELVKRSVLSPTSKPSLLTARWLTRTWTLS